MGYRPSPFFASWRGAIKFMLRPRYYLLRGYRKYKSGYFKIATLRDEYILVSDRAKISEVRTIALAIHVYGRILLTLPTKLLAAPGDVLSFLDIGVEVSQWGPFIMHDRGTFRQRVGGLEQPLILLIGNSVKVDLRKQHTVASRPHLWKAHPKYWHPNPRSC